MPPPDYSGGALQAITLCKKLCRKTNLFVVTSRSRGQAKRHKISNIQVTRLKYVTKKARVAIVSKLMFNLNLFCFLIKQRKNYDIIYCIGGGFILVPSVIVAKAMRKKVCVKLTRAGQRGDDPSAIKQNSVGWLTFQALKRTDAIICISQQLFDICKENQLDIDKLHRIPNGVDTKLFKPVAKAQKNRMRRELKIPIDSWIVSFAGGIIKRKGIDLMLEAISNVVVHYPKLLFIVIGPAIVGSEQYLSRIKRIIDTKNLHNNVLFTGHLEFNQARKYLQASDIYVHSSYAEGLPNSVMEAMACGLPCVAADIPPLRELITPNENGFLFSLKQVNEFQQKILQLLKDKTLLVKLGQKARKTIVEKYDIENVAEQYCGLFQKLLHMG